MSMPAPAAQPRRRILYIQHASALGGSCVSLRYTIEGLDRTRFEPIVALARPTKAVEEYYRAAGIAVVPWPGIGVWNHSTAITRPMYKPSTWLDLSRVGRQWPATERRTLELVDHVKPDLVHLNSVVLSPSAHALGSRKIPFVWHVREHPPHESLAWRTRVVGEMLERYPREAIFISEADRQAWVGGRCGTVVYNFVDFAKFDRTLDGSTLRRELGLPEGAPTLLYLGGLSPLKGSHVLVEAIRILRKTVPDVRVVAAGAKYDDTSTGLLRVARTVLPLVGSGTYVQRVEQAITRAGLDKAILRLPFRTDVAALLSASDALVFPATAPHFARPVVEAAAMGRPSVASDLPGISELIEHERTGLLVKPEDPTALAGALAELLTHRERARALGDAAHTLARQRFSAEQNCRAIMDVYDRIR